MSNINHNVIATLGVAQVTDNLSMKHIIETAALSMAVNEILTFIVNFDDKCQYEHDEVVDVILREAKVRMDEYKTLFNFYDVNLVLLEEHFYFPIYEVLCRL